MTEGRSGTSHTPSGDRPEAKAERSTGPATREAALLLGPFYWGPPTLPALRGLGVLSSLSSLLWRRQVGKRPLTANTGPEAPGQPRPPPAAVSPAPAAPGRVVTECTRSASCAQHCMPRHAPAPSLSQASTWPVRAKAVTGVPGQVPGRQT